MLFLKLGDVRWATLIPRDPRSFAMNGQDLAEASMAAAAATVLHGPESKTFSPGQPHGDLPPLENVRRYRYAFKFLTNNSAAHRAVW